MKKLLVVTLLITLLLVMAAAALAAGPPDNQGCPPAATGWEARRTFAPDIDRNGDGIICLRGDRAIDNNIPVSGP